MRAPRAPAARRPRASAAAAAQVSSLFLERVRTLKARMVRLKTKVETVRCPAQPHNFLCNLVNNAGHPALLALRQARSPHTCVWGLFLAAPAVLGAGSVEGASCLHAIHVSARLESNASRCKGALAPRTCSPIGNTLSPAPPAARLALASAAHEARAACVGSTRSRAACFGSTRARAACRARRARAQIKEVLQKYLGADDDLFDINLTAKCARSLPARRRRRSGQLRGCSRALYRARCLSRVSQLVRRLARVPSCMVRSAVMLAAVGTQGCQRPLSASEAADEEDCL